MTSDDRALIQLGKILGMVKVSPPSVGDKSLTPSQADRTLCPRKVYYKLIGAEARERDTLESRMAKEVGNTIHSVLQQWIREELADTEVEFVTRDLDLFGYKAHGRLDLIAPLGDCDYLIEIKSCSPKSYEKLTERPMPSHLFQMLFNAWLLNYWKPHIYLVVDRGTLRWSAKLIVLDKAEWDKELKALEQFVETYVKPGVVPDQPKSMPPSICPTCKYFHRCFMAAPAGNIPINKIFK